MGFLFRRMGLWLFELVVVVGSGLGMGDMVFRLGNRLWLGCGWILFCVMYPYCDGPVPLLLVLGFYFPSLTLPRSIFIRHIGKASSICIQFKASASGMS